MTYPLPETVAAFIDWPNIDRSIRSHFRGLSHQDVAHIVIYAIEVVAERIGALQSASAYADRSAAYSEAVPVLAANYRFNPHPRAAQSRRRRPMRRHDSRRHRGLHARAQCIAQDTALMRENLAIPLRQPSTWA